ncbi:MAG: glycosyltransferase family 2 protein [Pseudomonadota bacterium]
MTVQAVVWIALGLVAHTYVIYPVLVVVLCRLARSQAAPRPAMSTFPDVAIVVAACNEERHIAGRIRNLRLLDYPQDRLHIYVGSDGSTDNTVTLAQVEASPQLRVFPFERRRGKASVLNDLMQAVSEDLVVFTDANTSFDRSAVRELVGNFSDESVGAVSGELRLQSSLRHTDNQDGSYWRLETSLKTGESRVGGLLGANGGIYAIRRQLYRQLPPDTIVDDFTIVMTVAALGWQTIFEPRALAFEDLPPGIDDEFHRRVRIGTGNYQAFFRHPEYWTDASWSRRFIYLSHKVLRWFTPHLLLIALAATLLLAQQPFYRLLLTAQIAVYATLAACMLLRRHVRLPRLVNLPLFFFALNVAFIVGFWRYVAGASSGQWRRTERT